MKLEQWEWLSFYDLIFVDSLIYNILLRNNFKKNFEFDLKKKLILQKRLFTRELQRRVKKERPTHDTSVFADW